MSFGKNLQYLRQLSAGMTQETLAEKLNVSRQTISKWEMDAANPEMDKALEICKIFNCTLDNLFREEIDKRSDAYSDLRTEEVKGFRYVEYTVISRSSGREDLDSHLYTAPTDTPSTSASCSWVRPRCFRYARMFSAILVSISRSPSYG